MWKMLHIYLIPQSTVIIQHNFAIKSGSRNERQGISLNLAEDNFTSHCKCISQWNGIENGHNHLVCKCLQCNFLVCTWRKCPSNKMQRECFIITYLKEHIPISECLLLTSHSLKPCQKCARGPYWKVTEANNKYQFVFD